MEKKKATDKLNILNVDLIKHNITSLDLSYSRIKKFCEGLKLPPKLTELNLSHNNLETISEMIFNLTDIQILDISYNMIKYFDDTPRFCHNVKYINISNNKLQRPPAWIWFDSPQKLSKLDISCNIELTHEEEHGYFEELNRFKTSITEVIIYNCGLHKYLQLLATFPKAKILQIGCDDMRYLAANLLTDFPCRGVTQCCQLENINIMCTKIYNIKPNIDIYKKLIEINLSQNELSYLPNEFCTLENLEVCILSLNNIIYLPDDFVKLKRLKTLIIDSNQLCMLPENICSILNLKKLDLYNNYLNDVPLDNNKIEEMDLAQNYFEEPDDDEYIFKKQKLRKNITDRWDSRKYEKVWSETTRSPVTTDDESCFLNKENVVSDNESCLSSSEEDWDSNEHWAPHYSYGSTAQSQSPWLHYIYQKMKQGNFCPMDTHTIPVAEKVKYEKLCYPQIQYESDGQFDDYSSDDS